MLTPVEVESLDMALADCDAAALPPAAKSRTLYKTGRYFNPKPATRADINQYISNKNRSRPASDKLPLV